MKEQYTSLVDLDTVVVAKVGRTIGLFFFKSSDFTLKFLTNMQGSKAKMRPDPWGILQQYPGTKRIRVPGQLDTHADIVTMRINQKKHHNKNADVPVA
jgi:hypothetical protein